MQRQNEISKTEITSINDIRRQLGMNVLFIITISTIIYTIITYTAGRAIFGGEPRLTSLAIAAVSTIAYFMLRYKILTLVALHLPILIALASLLAVRTEDGFPILVTVTVVTAAIILQLPSYAIVIITTLIASIYFQQQSTTNFPFILTTIVGIGLSIVVHYVVYRFEKITYNSQRINNLLQGSSNIGQNINEDLDMQQLLDNTVNTVRDEFNFYHVQVFLIDERYEYANLVASTGEAGQKLLARNHRLPVGSQSVIGRVSQVGEPVIAQNTDADTVHALNELLPDTRAELALPLIDAGNIIGALDVQSIYADAFQPIDIQALQIIANQLAVAIRNARLFNEAQRNIQENKRLLFEYETNLREVDRLNRTLTKQSWDTYLGQTYVDGVTLSKDRFAPQADWSDIMRTATTSQQSQTDINGDAKIIAIPILLRGQVLGAIEVELETDSSTTDAVEIIEAISQRLAISLESARLFEETQEASLQEQQINEIVSSYETAVTIDELLQITLEKLQQSLGAEKGTIRLGVTSQNGTSTHHHNGNGGSPS